MDIVFFECCVFETKLFQHAVVKLVHILSYALQVPIVETSVIIDPNTFEQYIERINTNYDAKVASFPIAMDANTADTEAIIKEEIISDYRIYETPEFRLLLPEWEKRSG